MNTCHIYMPINGMNIQPYMNNYKTDHTKWKLVSSLKADNLEQCFFKGNWYNQNVRSLSVGDIVVDTNNNQAYMCDKCGWKEIEFDISKTQSNN